jgi:hypothetical protein
VGKLLDITGQKFGKLTALKLIGREYREQQINLLNLMGAGYTEGHGKPKQINLENV